MRALDEFTGALAANDAAVARFMDDFGAVSQQLAGEKQELQAALGNLAAVLGKIERFVRGNRELLNADLADLATVLKAIGDHKKTLEVVLDVAPSALGNLAVAFDPETDTIGSRLTFNGNVNDLDGQLCTLVQGRTDPVRRPGLPALRGAAGARGHPAVVLARHAPRGAGAAAGEVRLGALGRPPLRAARGAGMRALRQSATSGRRPGRRADRWWQR